MRLNNDRGSVKKPYMVVSLHSKFVPVVQSLQVTERHGYHMKKGKIIGILAISAWMLTGCIDHMPDMTEEQSELVAEYAADLLLKYSPNYQYRIADEEQLAEAQSEEKSMQEESTQEEQSEQAQEESEGISTDSSSVETQTSIEDGSEYDLASFFGMDAFTIRYQSCELTDSYPKADVGGGFSVTAPQGHNLLILHFDVENISEDTQECDLFDQISKVRVNVNDSGYRQALSTLLTNDFTTYMEEISAGDTKDVVVAVAVDETDLDEISSVIMRIATENDIVNISLE